MDLSSYIAASRPDAGADKERSGSANRAGRNDTTDIATRARLFPDAVAMRGYR
jgi:hypothetical protein